MLRSNEIARIVQKYRRSGGKASRTGMPLLVKYEQTGSYFSWLSKQLTNPLFPSCVRHYMHHIQSPHSPRNAPPLLSLSSQNPISAAITRTLFSLSPKINCYSLIEQTSLKPTQTLSNPNPVHMALFKNSGMSSEGTMLQVRRLSASTDSFPVVGPAP